MPNQNQDVSVDVNNVDDILADMISGIPDIQPHVVDNVNKDSIKEEPLVNKNW